MTTDMITVTEEIEGMPFQIIFENNTMMFYIDTELAKVVKTNDHWRNAPPSDVNSEWTITVQQAYPSLFIRAKDVSLSFGDFSVKGIIFSIGDYRGVRINEFSILADGMDWGPREKLSAISYGLGMYPAPLLYHGPEDDYIVTSLLQADSFIGKTHGVSVPTTAIRVRTLNGVTKGILTAESLKTNPPGLKKRKRSPSPKIEAGQ